MTLQHSPASQLASKHAGGTHSFIYSVRANTPPTPSLSDNGVHLAKYGGGRTVNNSTGLLVANPNQRPNKHTEAGTQADTLSDTAFGRQRKFSATLTYPFRISENNTHHKANKNKNNLKKM